VIRYALAWLGLGSIAAVAILLALGGAEDEGPAVAVPPVRETDLAPAGARRGGAARYLGRGANSTR
jgi:hypothetical protein